MKSILNAHPFSSNFLAPSPPSAMSLDVPGLIPSSAHPFQYGVFFVFAIFQEHFLSALFARVFAQSGAKYLFSTQTDSSHIIAQTHDRCY